MEAKRVERGERHQGREARTGYCAPPGWAGPVLGAENPHPTTSHLPVQGSAGGPGQRQPLHHLPPGARQRQPWPSSATRWPPGPPAAPTHTPGHWPAWPAHCNWPGLGRLLPTTPNVHFGRRSQRKTPEAESQYPAQGTAGFPWAFLPTRPPVQGLRAARRAEYLEPASSARQPVSRSGSAATAEVEAAASPGPGASCLHETARDPLTKPNPSRTEAQTPG